MKEFQIKRHQKEAFNAIVAALENNKNHIVVNMVTGSGKSIVLANVVKYLLKKTKDKILIVTSLNTIKEQIENTLFRDYTETLKNDRKMIDIKTIKQINVGTYEIKNLYKYIVVYDVSSTNECYKLLYNMDTTMISFHSHIKQSKNQDAVFTYGFQDAVKDGIIAPVADLSMYEYAADGFCERLLEKFNCKPISVKPESKMDFWDICFLYENKKVWVEYKMYRNKDISPHAINTLINNVVWHSKIKGEISNDDIVLLILFGNASNVDRKVLYSKFRIVVWDISNLIYYTKNDESLYDELSRLTYFPITDISGEKSEVKCFTIENESDDTKVELPITDVITEYINRLKGCPSGTKASHKYEIICEDIIRYLFSDAFYLMSSQHKTNDKHFRMDLICSFKEIAEKSHPFWRLLSHHYNTLFVVFEFKNYGKKLEQNLIYITEKYLFDSALRNVAIIVSRKGFSKTASFAAGGCLKENGKLLLSITDDDLIEMLNLKGKGGEPATILMDKYDNFLMSLGK